MTDDADITLTDSTEDIIYDGSKNATIKIKNGMSTATKVTAADGAFNPNPPTGGKEIKAGKKQTFNLGPNAGTYPFYWTIPDDPAQGTRNGTIRIT